MKHRFVYLYAAFVVSFLILVVLSFLFYSELYKTFENATEVENNHKMLYQLEGLNASVLKAEGSARGFMLTKDSIFLLPVAQEMRNIEQLIKSLRELARDDDIQRNRLAYLHANIKLRLRQQTMNLGRIAKSDTAGLKASLLKGRSIMDIVEEEIRKVEDRQRDILAERFAEKKSSEKITPNYFKYILIFAGLLTLVTFFFLNAELRKRLRYQRQLEKKLNELHQSNIELEQIAYVASHDLQEPLRKIRTFSSRLVSKYKDSLTADVVADLNRIDASAIRMHDLINEVVHFTNLIHSSERAEPVSLNDVVDTVLLDLQEEITAKKAKIYRNLLPRITGYPHQLFLLFRSLLDNALKFSREGMAPEIRITLQHNDAETAFYRISVEDNGIGFDNVFEEKIFVIFQRLHNQQSGYKGKGIGLAVVQRVMVNHQGMVIAKGKPGSGAVFTLYFPVSGG